MLQSDKRHFSYYHDHLYYIEIHHVILDGSIRIGVLIEYHRNPITLLNLSVKCINCKRGVGPWNVRETC